MDKILFDCVESCNKCGNKNTVVIKDSIDGLPTECGTLCTVCGFEDYWGTGFFESRLDGYDKSNKYHW